MREYIANQNDDGVRISRFVLRSAQNLPESVLHKSFRNRRIKVNGARVDSAYRLRAGDVVQLYINDEYFSSPVAKPLPPVAGFDIVWESEELAVLFKPAGLLSHSDAQDTPNLLDSFTSRLIQNGEYDPAAENGFTPALCNRLDRGTEGLVLAAKTHPTLRAANEAIREGLVRKTYRCITLGTPPEGEHHACLVRDKAAKLVTVSTASRPGSKPIHTGVRVLDTHNGYALCEVQLYTGRTHQIRAHLAFLGTPVLGDAKYGNAAANRMAGLSRQALCAWQLSFSQDVATAPGHPGIPAHQSFTCAGYAHLPQIWNGLLK